MVLKLCCLTPLPQKQFITYQLLLIFVSAIDLKATLNQYFKEFENRKKFFYMKHFVRFKKREKRP